MTGHAKPGLKLRAPVEQRDAKRRSGEIGRGSKLGSFLRGSIPWHCLRLETGETLLVSDSSNDSARMIHLDLTLRRLEQKAPGTWRVQTCWGHAVAEPGTQFKFFRITRIT